ncbi:MAG TPA: GAF domain-containing protein, partial [Candidatus Limnocylindria bacterium]|nr:GAF domain-containing protein [Candidatus Limnocylindria bacterium]
MRALAERALATSWVLVAAVAVLVCGPVILAGELAAQDSQQRFHRAAIDATADAARGAASEIEARIASVKRDVERVGALDLGPAIRAGDLEAVHSRTVQLLQPGTRAPISPEIANLWISDGAGRPIGIWGHDVFVILRDFSGQSDVIRRSVLVPPDVGSSDFFAIAKRQVAALNTRPFVTRNVRFDPPFSAVGPLVVAPVRDGLELAGIIVAQLKTSEIVKPLLSHTAQVDDLVLFDDAGRQVAQASNPLATYVDLSASTIVQTALRGGTVEGDAPNPLGDGQRVVAVANVADTGWRIAAVMAASVAERDLADSLAQQRIARLALTGLVLIGAVALATAVSEVSRRRRALAHALERQTAVSEVLKIISRSPIQLDAVFEAVIASAVQLCRADNGGIVRIDNGRTHVAAHWGSHHDATAINDYWATHNITADRSTLTGRVLLERRSVAIADVHTEPGYVVRDVPGRDPRPDHSMLGVPLLREGEVVGVMVLRRREVKPFTSAEVAVAETFASQAVIAIENVRLFNETKESLDQQTALSDVLRTISRSAFDLDAVLQTIVERAVALVGGAESAAITRREGDEAIVLAGFGSVLQTLMAHGGRTPVSDKSLIGRALLTGKRQYIADATLDPSLPQDGPRTRLVIPFLRDGRAIGTLGVSHTLPRPFSDREMQMLETFADQAAIAIENVRLFNQTKESLERQTALAEILRVIADSPSDRQPVLEAVARSTTRYCGAEDATVFLVDGNELRRVAHHGPIPIRNETAPLDEQGVAGHAILTRRTIHVADIESAEGDRYPLTRAFAAESGRRGSLAAPLMREGTPIGVILLRKMEPTGFSQSQIQLVEAFADQAMIAIENVRLFNETKEALERQVALGEVLRTMASSPADLGAVLDAIAQNAARFCAAEDCGLALLRADGLLEQVAHFGPLTRELAPWPVDRGSVRGRAIVERRIIQVEDMLAEREEEYPIGLQRAREVGQRTVLAAPLLHEGTPLGAIALRRSSVKPFTDRQIDLLRTFADQAAIAIENVRLFNETKESLERQTALAEILRVIASSPSDQQPVFDAIAANATRYCGAKDAVVLLVQGETLVPVADHGPIPSPNIIPNPIVRTGVAGRAILDRRTVHVADLTSPAGEEFPLARMRSAEGVGHRGILATPLLREDTAIGAILLRRLEPSGFTPSEIQLVEAF